MPRMRGSGDSNHMLQSSGDCISAHHVARDTGLAVRREVNDDMIDRLPFTSEGLE